MDANDAASYVQDLAGNDANIIFGAKFDETMADEATITVIATGLDDGEKRASQNNAQAGAPNMQNDMGFNNTPNGRQGAGNGFGNNGYAGNTGYNPNAYGGNNYGGNNYSGNNYGGNNYGGNNYGDNNYGGNGFGSRVPEGNLHNGQSNMMRNPNGMGMQQGMGNPNGSFMNNPYQNGIQRPRQPESTVKPVEINIPDFLKPKK